MGSKGHRETSTKWYGSLENRASRRSTASSWHWELLASICYKCILRLKKNKFIWREAGGIKRQLSGTEKPAMALQRAGRNHGAGKGWAHSGVVMLWGWGWWLWASKWLCNGHSEGLALGPFLCLTCAPHWPKHSSLTGKGLLHAIRAARVDG